MAQKTQNFKNHVRLVKGHHFATYGLIGILFVAGVAMLFCHPWVGALLLVNVMTLTLISWYSRVFALRAQDRAIRAEENFRHFLLTGKPLSSNLRIGQIVALRFAPDEEFVALAERAEKENMKGRDIKQAIKNWKGDYHRV